MVGEQGSTKTEKAGLVAIDDGETYIIPVEVAGNTLSNHSGTILTKHSSRGVVMENTEVDLASSETIELKTQTPKLRQLQVGIDICLGE